MALPQVPTPTGVQRAKENVGSTSDDDNTASGGTTKTVQNQSAVDKNKCASASTRLVPKQRNT